MTTGPDWLFFYCWFRKRSPIMVLLNRPLIAALAVLWLAGCGLLTAEDGFTVVLSTEAERYELPEDAGITLTVFNQSESPVFFLCTGQIYLEEL